MSSKSVPRNRQGLPMDPRDAKVLPRAPRGSPSGASGSTPGPSKTYVFLKQNNDFQDFTDLCTGRGSGLLLEALGTPRGAPGDI